MKIRITVQAIMNTALGTRRLDAWICGRVCAMTAAQCAGRKLNRMRALTRVTAAMSFMRPKCTAEQRSCCDEPPPFYTLQNQGIFHQAETGLKPIRCWF